MASLLTRRVLALVLIVATSLLGLAPFFGTQGVESAVRLLSGTETGPALTQAIQSRVSTASVDPRRGDLPPFGITVIGPNQGSVAQARYVGAQSILTGLLWSDIEPTRTDPPTYNWSEADRVINLAVDNGLEPFILITGNPSWAYTGDYKVLTEQGRTALAQMVTAAAERYRGKARLWSFYNEPDCSGPTAPVGSPSSCYGNFGAEYTAMLQAVYPALKGVDPNNLVAIGGIAYDRWETDFAERFLDDVLASGGGAFFDLMNFHYYTEFADKWNAYGPDVIGKTNYIRNVLAKYGVAKPIILTEIAKQGAQVGDEGQADYLIQGMTRAFAAGNEMVIWYELYDSPQDAGFRFGLIDVNGVPKPGYMAYLLLSRKLSGMTWSGCPEHYPGVEAYSFNSGNGSRTIVAWTVDGNTRQIQVPASQIGRTTRTGESAVIRDADDGQPDGVVQVTVGGSPVFLDVTVATHSGGPGTAPFKAFFPLIARTLCR